MTCRESKVILSAQLEGEATASQWRAVEQHLAECRACAQLWEDFQASTALLKTELIRYEPSKALWEKISARIETAPQLTWAERWREKWQEVRSVTWFGVPRFAFGSGLAVVLVLLTLTFWRHQSTTQLSSTPQPDSTAVAINLPKPAKPRLELGENDPLLRIRLAQQVADYFEATRLVLLEVKNNTEASQEFDVSEVKQSSQKLLEQSLMLKAELKNEQLAIVLSTVEQLEVVLFDLANLEEKPEPEEMNMLRAAIQQGDLLIKIEIIDLAALTRKANDKPASSRPQRRVLNPSI